MKTTKKSSRQEYLKGLRREYMQAVRKYRYYRTMRQATLDVLKKGVSLDVPTHYSKLNFNTLQEKGTYRIRKTKDGFKRVQYKGINAIKLQLKSLKKQTSAEYRKNIFIKNYLKSMQKVGYSLSERNEIRDKLKNLSSQKLTLAIDSAEFPSIQYNYANGGQISINNLKNRIEASIVNITPEQQLLIKKRYKALLPKFKQDIKGY